MEGESSGRVNMQKALNLVVRSQSIAGRAGGGGMDFVKKNEENYVQTVRGLGHQYRRRDPQILLQKGWGVNR